MSLTEDEKAHKRYITKWNKARSAYLEILQSYLGQTAWEKERKKRLELLHIHQNSLRNETQYYDADEMIFHHACSLDSNQEKNPIVGIAKGILDALATERENNMNMLRVHEQVIYLPEDVCQKEVKNNRWDWKVVGAEIKTYLTCEGMDRLAKYAKITGTTLIHHRGGNESQFYHESDKERNPANLILEPETPPGSTWFFDLNRLTDQHYRRWYLQQNGVKIRSTISLENRLDSTLVWYNICDLLAFYGCRDMNKQVENQQLYEQIRATSEMKALYAKAKELGKIASKNNEDYIRSQDFDDIFMGVIHDSIFARRIYLKMNPAKALGLEIVVVKDKAMKETSFSEAPVKTLREIKTEFVRDMEATNQTVGYYYKDSGGKEYTFYNLKEISAFVLATKNKEKVTEKWKSEGWSEELQHLTKAKKIWMVTSEKRNVIEINHFLLSLAKILDCQYAKDIQNAQVHELLYPPIKRPVTPKEPKNVPEKNSVESEQQFLKRYLEMTVEAFSRRVHGKHKNLYGVDNIRKVEGPQGYNKKLFSEITDLLLREKAEGVEQGTPIAPLWDEKTVQKNYFGLDYFIDKGLPLYKKVVKEREAANDKMSETREAEIVQVVELEKISNDIRKVNTVMEFDPARCGSYVWRAKWMMNCGKNLRVKQIDGKTMLCIPDMMNIHGDYRAESLRKCWSQLKGNQVQAGYRIPVREMTALTRNLYLATLKVQNLDYNKDGPDQREYLTFEEVKSSGMIYSESKNGGTVDFTGLSEFDEYILSHINSPVAKALLENGKLVGRATNLGSRRSNAISDQHREEMLELKRKQPQLAAVLWQYLEDVEVQQEVFVTPEQALIQSTPYESNTDLVVVRDTELHRSVTAKEVRLTVEAQEKTKWEMENRLIIQAQEKTKQMIEAEETKRKEIAETEETKRKEKAEETLRKNYLQTEETKRKEKANAEETTRKIEEETTKREIRVAMERTRQEEIQTKNSLLTDKEREKTLRDIELTKRQQIHLDELRIKDAAEAREFEKMKWLHAKNLPFQVEVPAPKPKATTSKKRGTYRKEQRSASPTEKPPPKYRSKVETNRKQKNNT